jgi:hypothetical protein
MRLEVLADADVVRVAVGDGDPGLPAPRDADDDAEGGRGMVLVDLLAAEHGVAQQPPGKTVWASVTRRGRASLGCAMPSTRVVLPAAVLDGGRSTSTR